MKNFDFKTILPHIGALALFLVLSFLYLSPMLEGKRVYQSDLIQFKGMNKSVSDYREATGEEALWADNMFSGMPAYQISVHWTANLIKKVDALFRLYLPRPADYLFILMAGFYFLGIVLGLPWWGALIGAFAMAFSSYSVIIIEAGHTSKVHAMAYMAPVLASIILAYRGKALLGSALLALFLSLQISANHLQITYYLLIMILIMGIAKMISSLIEGQFPKFFNTTLLLAFGAFLAIGPNIGNLWATQEYGKYTMRGPSELTAHKESDGLDKDYALRWSYGKMETFSLLIPNFYGGASQGTLSESSETYQSLMDHNIPRKQAEEIVANLPLYWGDQPFTSGPVYLGALVCFLFVLGLFLVKNEDRWWLLAALVVSIVFAWGRHIPWFTDIIFTHLPLYNKFRAVSMTLVIAQVAVPFLGLLALKNFFSGEIATEELKKKLIMSAGIVGGILLIYAAIPGLAGSFEAESDAKMRSGGYPDWLVDAIVSDRESMLRMDALRSLGFIILGAGAMLLYTMDKLKSQVVMVILAALVLVDLWAVDKRYLNEEDFVNPRKLDGMYTMTPADQQILQDTDPNFRVYNLTEALDRGARTSYYHKNLAGYHGAKLKRYQELIDYQISKGNIQVINMLNTKYIIRQGQEGQAPIAMPNPSAMGNAWFVPEYEIVANPDSELNALTDFVAAKTAIIDKRFEDQLKGYQPQFDSTATIQLTDYKPNHLTYQTKANGEQLAVFSEIYYDKGWKAYVDGEEVPYMRANFVLRAMKVPAGEHTVEFKFKPAAFYTGQKISLIASLLLFAFVGFAGYTEVKKRKADED